MQKHANTHVNFRCSNSDAAVGEEAFCEHDAEVVAECWRRNAQMRAALTGDIDSIGYDRDFAINRKLIIRQEIVVFV